MVFDLAPLPLEDLRLALRFGRCRVSAFGADVINRRRFVSPLGQQILSELLRQFVTDLGREILDLNEGSKLGQAIFSAAANPRANSATCRRN